MAEDARRKEEEIAALRLGFDLGMTLIDTAEMYADGGADRKVGSHRCRGRAGESRPQHIASVRIETWPAQPIDRAIARDESRCFAITNKRIVLDA
jgi:hypothetical protein